MFKKATLLLFLTIAFVTTSKAQTNYDWKLGVGASIVKFGDKHTSFVGDKHLIQIPRFNITRRINNNFSADVAVALGTIKKLVVTNDVSYFSVDVSGRYQYLQDIEKIEPYVFIGGSMVGPASSNRKITPTFNIGTGATYWVTEKIGANAQIYYKHSLESFESMRSHIQISFGVVFGLDLSGSGRRGSTDCKY